MPSATRTAAIDKPRRTRPRRRRLPLRLLSRSPKDILKPRLPSTVPTSMPQNWDGFMTQARQSDGREDNSNPRSSLTEATDSTMKVSPAPAVRKNGWGVGEVSAMACMMRPTTSPTFNPWTSQPACAHLLDENNDDKYERYILSEVGLRADTTVERFIAPGTEAHVLAAASDDNVRR